MSKQDLDALINLLKADPNLRSQLAACSSVEEAESIIQAAGFLLSADEILGLRSGAVAFDLTDAELEGVSGGDEKTQGCKG